MTWVTDLPVPLATHTECASTARPSGPAPTRTGGPVAPVTGSMRWIVLSPLLATQTPLGPAAMAAGTLPTGMRLTSELESALIRDTLPSPEFATHTSSPVTAIATGWAWTGIV